MHRLAFAALLLVSSCKQPRLRLAGPALSVDPGALAFGEVSTGAQKQLQVNLLNSGTGTLNVAEIAWQGSASFAVAKILNRDCQGRARQGSGSALAAGDCAGFVVTYAPLAEEAGQGTITVRSDDPDKPEQTVAVTGAAVSASLSICVLKEDSSLGACSTATTVPALDFGAVATNTTTTRKLRLKNTGSGDLLFGHHGLAAGSAPDFTMPAEVPTGRIAAGASVDLALVFAPTSNGTKRGDLELLTNDRARPALTVPLLGAVAGWRVCVVPDQGLDFGSITTGATRTLPVSLQNCGNVALQLTSMALLPFAPTVNEFHQAGIPALPLSLAPGAEVKLDVTYAPSVERVDKASIDYAIRLPADGATPPQDLRDSIPVTGTGAPPVCNGTRPTAVLKTALANGVFFNPATFSPEPLETVTLDGSASTAVSGALQYAFRLVSQPQNGNQAIRGTGAKPTLWLELAGDYVVELVVRDAACQSAAVTATIHAVPKGAVHVQLSWSQSYGDLDLHYVGPGGQYFQGLNGCVFAPCGDTFFGMARPDWGCADRNCNALNGVYPDGKTANDASLDIDQQWGNGPENINHKLAFDGSYEVWVHYFCAHKCDYSAGTCSGNAFGDATPTIKVFVNGVQQFAKSISLSEFAAWDVARVTVSGNGTQITVADANRAPVASPQGCLNH